MKRFRSLIAANWQSWLLTALVIFVVVGLLWYQLATITPGISREELESLQGVGSLKAIALNPLYLPFKLALYGLIKLNLQSIWWIRSTAALFGLVTVLAFYFVLRIWYTKRISVMGTLLFTTSAWFLHVARIATPAILFPLCAALLILYGAYVHATKHSKTALMLGFMILALSLYVPGLIWLAVCFALWQRKLVATLVKNLAVWQLLLAGLLGIVLIAPLVYASIYDWRILLHALAIPTQFTPHEWLIQAYQVPKLLFIRGPQNPSVWVGTIPLLDILMIGMFILGAYHYYLRRNLVRTSILVLFFAVAIVLMTFSTAVTIGILLPAVFLIITAGIVLMLQQWLTVFPRNPVARSLGFVILAIAVLVSVWFQLNSYFVAWPKSPTTKAAYHYKLQS